MVLIAIVWLMLSIVSMSFLAYWNSKNNPKTKNKPIGRKEKEFWGLLTILLTLLLLMGIYVVVCQEQEKNNAEAVITVDQRELYYCESEDAYFFVKTNDWKIHPIAERVYIDNEDAKALIEKANALKELTEKLKEKY